MEALKSRYLVTGGCGFIGSHLADALLARGHRVRILDNLATGARENAPREAELVIGDVADRAAVREAVSGVDGVFHLAAIASIELSNADWVAAHSTNSLGSVTVMDAARQARPEAPVPVVYASSAAVYGLNERAPLSEDETPAPVSAYGIDKLGSELHARIASSLHGVPTLGLRYFNVYGPRQNPSSPYSGVVSIFCHQAASGQPLTIRGDGQQRRDFVYVGDAVEATIRAMTQATLSAEVLNICTGQATSILQLAKIIAGLAGVSAKLEFLEPRPGDIAVSLGDPARAMRRLGIKPATGLEAGLRQTLDFQRRPASSAP
jgi:UDP-glucose 4-epimerase